MDRLTGCKLSLRMFAASGERSEAVIPGMLKCLRELFDAQGAAFYWCDADGIVTQYFADHAMGSVLRIAEGSLAMAERDFGITYQQTLLYGKPVNNSQEIYERGFEQTESFQQIFAQHGMRWQLDGVVRSRDRPYGMVILVRAASQANFSAAEAASLEELLPYFVHALKADESFASAIEAGRGVASSIVPAHKSAVFLLNELGELEGKTDDARALVAMAFRENRLGPGHRETFDDNSLMWDELVELCHTLHEALKKGSADEHPCAVRRTRWGEFEFRAYRIQLPKKGIHSAIVLNHFTPSRIMGLEKIRQLPLSVRQKELCWLMLKGLKGADMAAQMGLSQPTVKEYQRTVYDKLGVSGKEDLLKFLGRA